MTRRRAYAALLLLYPTSFRREYEEQMLEAFADLSRDSDQSPVRFWRAVAWDLCRSLLREYLDVWTCGMARVGFSWIVACSLGASIGGAAVGAFMLSWTLLFPPQADPDGAIRNLASNLPVGVYGALIGLVVGAVQGLALRQHCRRTGLWILATSIAVGTGFPLAFAVSNRIGVRLVGYFAGVALLGLSVGLLQGLVFRRQIRSVTRWIVGNAIAVPAGILTGIVCDSIHRVSPSTSSGLMLAFVLYPAAVGAVIGVFTVHSLTTILSGRRQGLL